MPKNITETHDVTFASRGQVARPVDTGNPHGNRGADVSRGDPEADKVNNKVPGSAPQEAGVVGTGSAHGNRGADATGIDEPTHLPVGANVVPGQSGKAGLVKETIEKLASLPAEKIQAVLAGLTETAAPEVDTVANVVAEDLKELFGSLNLSEDFQGKATTIFEAAVSAKVAQRKIELEEQYEAKTVTLKEEITTEVAAEYESKVDKYLSFVAEEWAEDNKIAIEQGVQAELSESFMTGLKKLFEEHWVSVPAEKVDALSAVTEELSESEKKTNDIAKRLIEAEETIASFKKKDVLATLSEGLTIVERDRFSSLAETVNVSDLEVYKQKLTVLRESVTGTLVVEKDKPADGAAGLSEAVQITEASTARIAAPYKSIYDN